MRRIEFLPPSSVNALSQPLEKRLFTIKDTQKEGKKISVISELLPLYLNPDHVNRNDVIRLGIHEPFNNMAMIEKQPFYPPLEPELAKFQYIY